MSPPPRGAARTCRENGWGVGTVLERSGDDGIHRIRITAIGESAVLTRVVVWRGERTRGAAEAARQSLGPEWVRAKS